MYDNGFAETFDTVATGNFNPGGNWTMTNTTYSSVSVVSSPDPAVSGKTLLLIDNQNASGTDYTEAPIVQRTTTPLSGNVSFETRFWSSELGNLELMLQNSGTNVYNGSTATASDAFRIASNLRTSDYYFDYVKMNNK
jgi:uncharacterized membrane protein